MDPQKSLASLPLRLMQLKGNQSTASFSRFLGVGISTLHNYEKGRIPPLEFLLLVAQKTGVNLQWLLTGEGNQFRDDRQGVIESLQPLTVLVVDDKEYQRESLVNLLETEGYSCVQAGSLPEARERLSQVPIDIVVTDLRMPNENDGLQLLKEINEKHDKIKTIIVTVHAATARTAVEAIRLGAIDYLVMSRNFPDELRDAIRRAEEQIRSEASPQAKGEHELGFGSVVGTTPEMQQAIEMMRRAIDSPGMPVLILGEPGTGKELMAKTIHQYDSDRCKRSFVPVKCGSMSDDVLRFELLGGSMVVNGETQTAPGVFNIADGGTVFLDEVDTISPMMQVALTRLLEEGVAAPLGEGEPKTVDIRLIGASHQDMEALTARGVFRRELYSALSVVTIRLPNLAERQADLPHLVRQTLQESGQGEITIEPAALAQLSSLRFRDNVRGLKTLVQRAALLADDGTITEAVLTAAQNAG